jgi:hypothetical protein
MQITFLARHAVGERACPVLDTEWISLSFSAKDGEGVVAIILQRAVPPRTLQRHLSSRRRGKEETKIAKCTGLHHKCDTNMDKMVSVDINRRFGNLL